MSEKRFYWLKLPKDFFKRHDITFLFSLPNGHQIVLFYLELMTESIDHDGELRFSPELPYTDEMLASITHTDIEIVKTSMETLEKLKLVKISEDGTIVLEKVKTMTGYETKWAEKKRVYREQKRQSEDNVLNVSPECPEMSDKSKSKSKSKNIFLSPIDEKKFIPPTVEEVYQYCKERHNGIDAQLFVDYYTARAWKGIDDWRALVRTWENNNLRKDVI